MDTLGFYKSMLCPGEENWVGREVSFDGVRVVTAEDAIAMLKAYSEQQLNYAELLDWANLVLFNSSFDFDGEVLRDCLDRIEESDEPGKSFTAEDVAALIQELS